MTLALMVRRRACALAIFRVPLTAVSFAIKLTVRGTPGVGLFVAAMGGLGVFAAAEGSAPSAKRIFLTLCLVLVVLA